MLLKNTLQAAIMLSSKEKPKVINDLKKLKKRKLVLCSDEELMSSNSEKEWNPESL